MVAGKLDETKDIGFLLMTIQIIISCDDRKTELAFTWAQLVPLGFRAEDHVSKRRT